MTQHFDQCLDCMGCVTACPSGLRYDQIIEVMRAGRACRGAPPSCFAPCSSRCFPIQGG